MALADSLSVSDLNQIARDTLKKHRPGDSSPDILDRVWRQIDKATGEIKPWHRAGRRLDVRRRLALDLAHAGYVFNPDYVDAGGEFVIPHGGEMPIDSTLRTQFETLFGPVALPLRAPVRLKSSSDSWIPGWVYLGVAVVREDSMTRMFSLLDRACPSSQEANLQMVVANEMANEILQRPVNRATRFTRADAAAVQNATAKVRIDERLEVEEFISDAASAGVAACGWKVVLAHLVFAALSPEHDAHAVSAGFLLALVEEEEERLSVPRDRRLRSRLLDARRASDRATATRIVARAFDNLNDAVITDDFNRYIQTRFLKAGSTAVDVLLKP